MLRLAWWDFHSLLPRLGMGMRKGTQRMAESRTRFLVAAVERQSVFVLLVWSLWSCATSREVDLEWCNSEVAGFVHNAEMIQEVIDMWESIRKRIMR